MIALLILAPAAYLQLHAASLAGLLSAMWTLHFAAAAYVGASCASLVISIVLLAVVGVVGMAIGLLAGASVLTGSLVLYVRRFDLHSRISPRWLRERKQYALAGLLAAGAAPGIAIQLDLGLSLAVIPHHTGEITAYSYAFFLCSLILTVSAVRSQSCRCPISSRDSPQTAIGWLGSSSSGCCPTAAVLVPLASLLIAFGRPVLLTGLGPALSRQTIQLLYELAVIFCALALVLAPLYLCGAVTLAMKRYGILLRMGAVLVIVNAVLVALASPGGSRAVAAAQVVAAAIGTGYLLRVTFGARCGSVVAGAAKAVRPAFALSLVIFALRAPLGWYRRRDQRRGCRYGRRRLRGPRSALVAVRQRTLRRSRPPSWHGSRMRRRSPEFSSIGETRTRSTSAWRRQPGATSRAYPGSCSTTSSRASATTRSRSATRCASVRCLTARRSYWR